MYMDTTASSPSLLPHYSDTASGILPVSPFSAFHLLRNYNYLITPPCADLSKISTETQHCRLQQEPTKPECITPLSLDIDKPFPSTFNQYPHFPQLLAAQNLFAYHNHAPLPPSSPHSNALLSPDTYLTLKRHRGEKKPIPDDQKDDKYYERRRRNNQAAKKSRDARKIREDQVALKATILEHENAILKAQVLTLREEASSLRQMLLQKKTFSITS